MPFLERHCDINKYDQAVVWLKGKRQSGVAILGIGLSSHWQAFGVYILPCLVEQCFLGVLPNIVFHWPENSLAVPEVEVDKEKSCAKDDFRLFLLFVLYQNGVSIFRY